VLATWWATKAAYTLYVLLILALFALTFYTRTKRLTQRAKTLTRAVEQRTGELRRETQKVNQLLEDKDRLIANISHEFRTPLTLILEAELQTSNNDKSKGLLSLAKANGQRKIYSIDDMRILVMSSITRFMAKSLACARPQPNRQILSRCSAIGRVICCSHSRNFCNLSTSLSKG
jgi:signal transduction histidine kinase